MTDQEQAFADISQHPGFLLGKQAAIHLVTWVASFSLFAATDSWAVITGWPLAAFLNVLTGILAGFVTVNLVHEWFHYLGARLASARYTIADRPGLFVFNWQFDDNTLPQFYLMSIAGSVGGALAVLTLFAAIDADNAGRTALLAGAAGAFALGAIIEWPVLMRTRRSRNPLAELSKLTPPVLGRALGGSALAGVLCALLLAG